MTGLKGYSLLCIFLTAVFSLLACQKEVPPHKKGMYLKTTRLPRLKEKAEYAVELLPIKATQVGKQAEGRVHLRSKGMYHINTEYPLSFIVDGSDRLRAPRFKSAHFTPCAHVPQLMCEMHAKIPLTVNKNLKFSGILAFSVCEKTRCLIEKAHLSTNIQVKN